MNILLITAHPSSKGLTHGIAETYRKEKEAGGDTVHEIDLYKDPCILPFLSFENMREYHQCDRDISLEAEVTWANELVFVHPLWWGTMPGIMKNFLDRVFSVGFAYKYSKEGKVSGLLAGKTAKIFTTSGNRAIYYIWPFLPFKSIWIEILHFCGIKIKEFNICGSMDIIRDEEKKKAHIAKFLAKVKKSAKVNPSVW